MRDIHKIVWINWNSRNIDLKLVVTVGVPIKNPFPLYSALLESDCFIALVTWYEDNVRWAFACDREFACARHCFERLAFDHKLNSQGGIKLYLIDLVGRQLELARGTAWLSVLVLRPGYLAIRAS